MKRPVCGMTSVLMPFVIYAASHALDRVPHLGEGMNGYEGLFIVGFMYVGIALGCLAGAALGVAAWFRREPYRAIGVIGIVVSVLAMPALIHGR